jgi:hypothetical protein
LFWFREIAGIIKNAIQVAFVVSPCLFSFVISLSLFILFVCILFVLPVPPSVFHLTWQTRAMPLVQQPVCEKPHHSRCAPAGEGPLKRYKLGMLSVRGKVRVSCCGTCVNWGRVEGVRRVGIPCNAFCCISSYSDTFYPCHSHTNTTKVLIPIKSHAPTNQMKVVR